MTTAPTFQFVESDVTPKDVRLATWICFFAWTFAVYDFVLFGNLLPMLASDLGWSAAQSTGINTWVTAGTALVAFGIGPIVDRIGRRKGILIAVIGAAVASLLTATVGWVVGIAAGLGLVFLILVRSLAGLGYAEQAINAAYLNEMFAHNSDPAKARRRGLIYSLVQSGWPVGSVLAAGSVYLLFPVGGWALCFAVAAIPAVFIVIAGRWLKESPQFGHRHQIDKMIKDGRVEEAQQLGEKFGIDVSEKASPLVSVFRGESLRSTLTIGGAFLLNWLGVLAFAILGTSLLTAPDGKNVEFDNALLVLIISNATAFAGYLFHGWLGDRIGRRNAIGIGWILCAVSFFTMLQAPNGNFPLIIGLYSAGLFFLIGPFSALLFFTGESFPVHTRATRKLHHQRLRPSRSDHRRPAHYRHPHRGSRLDQRHPMVGRPPHPGLRPAHLRRPERRPQQGPHGLTGPNPHRKRHPHGGNSWGPGVPAVRRTLIGRLLRFFAQPGLLHQPGHPWPVPAVKHHALGQPLDGGGGTGNIDGCSATGHGRIGDVQVAVPVRVGQQGGNGLLGEPPAADGPKHTHKQRGRVDAAMIFRLPRKDSPPTTPRRTSCRILPGPSSLIGSSARP